MTASRPPRNRLADLWRDSLARLERQGRPGDDAPAAARSLAIAALIARAEAGHAAETDGAGPARGSAPGPNCRRMLCARG